MFFSVENIKYFGIEMTYYTTMNLPAPSYTDFAEKYNQYKNDPYNAISDFENALKRFFDVEAATTFSNCFTALSIALNYATRDKPKTVATQGMAYRRTTDIILWAGLNPVYVDNSSDSTCMSFKDLIKKLETVRVGCILVQHPMVKMCDVDQFLEIGEAYEIPVVFDSVEATGASYNERRIGGFGLAESFSLHPSKVINAAEGGVLTFGDIDEHRSFNRHLVEIGVLCPHTGRKQLFSIEPVHAIMGMASLEIYDKVCSVFKKQYLRYLSHLKNLKSLDLIEYDFSTNPNFKSILVRLKDNWINGRSKLLAHLESFNIGARAYYSPLHQLTDKELLPNARAMAERYIFLPIGHSVKLTDIDYICEIIAKHEKGAEK
jgi:dTDP-4-amino-4,6-dideoxyglucose